MELSVRVQESCVWDPAERDEPETREWAAEAGVASAGGDDGERADVAAEPVVAVEPDVSADRDEETETDFERSGGGCMMCRCRCSPCRPLLLDIGVV